VVIFTPWPVYLLVKGSQYLLDRRLRVPQSHLDMEAKRKVFCPCLVSSFLEILLKVSLVQENHKECFTNVSNIAFNIKVCFFHSLFIYFRGTTRIQSNQKCPECDGIVILK
jgi:hypothetical protein